MILLMPYKNIEDARAYGRRARARYRAANPELVKAEWAAWYEANKERQSEKVKAKWASGIGREQKRQWDRDWYARHHEELLLKRASIRAADPEHYLIWGVQSRATKRAREMGVAITLTTAEWRWVRVSYGNRCAYCSSPEPPLTQDHVLAMSQGGTHTIDNVVPACGPCNSSKGTLPVGLWLERRNFSTPWAQEIAPQGKHSPGR